GVGKRVLLDDLAHPPIAALPLLVLLHAVLAPRQVHVEPPLLAANPPGSHCRVSGVVSIRRRSPGGESSVKGDTLADPRRGGKPPPAQRGVFFTTAAAACQRATAAFARVSSAASGATAAWSAWTFAWAALSAACRAAMFGTAWAAERAAVSVCWARVT